MSKPATMGPFSWFTYSIKGRPFNLQLESGTLTCDIDDTFQWCEHLEYVIQNGLDQDTIWTQFEKATEIPVTVPIFPSKMVFFAVRLQLMEFPVPTARILELSGDKFYGLLTEGDGRNAIRNILLSDLMANNNIAECSSPSHKFASQMQFEKNMKDSTGRLAECWSLLHEGKCLACLDPANSDNEFGDLVPEKDGWS